MENKENMPQKKGFWDIANSLIDNVKKAKEFYDKHEDTIKKTIDTLKSFVFKEDSSRPYSSNVNNISYTNQQLLDSIRRSVTCGNFMTFGSSGKFIYLVYHFGSCYKLDVAIDTSNYNGFVNLKDRNNRCLSENQISELRKMWHTQYSMLDKKTLCIKRVLDARKSTGELAETVSSYLKDF